MRPRGGRGLGLVVAAAAVAGCAILQPWSPPSPTPGEQMPGPASVWLTSEPAAPVSPVDVLMTSPDDPGTRFAHTFAAGQPLRGSFATSEGRYTLSALRGACSLAIVLASDDAADVLLTLQPDGGCALAVARRGRMGDPAMQKTEGGVLITNHDAGGTTPPFEASPASAAP